MRATGVKYLIGKGFTADIVKTVLNCYKSYWTQCEEVAAEFKGADELQTCKNIWMFLTTKINYVLDPRGKQWVRTPARFVSDGQGDCKSFAVITASILKCLGIKGVIRFVSYDKNPDNIQHVYVVTDTGIIIDATPQADKTRKFNYQANYGLAKDFDYMKAATEISILAGVDTEKINLYTDGKFFMDCTSAENYLHSEIDYTTTLINVYQDDENYLRECCTSLIHKFIALELYLEARDNQRGLERAARIYSKFELDYYYDKDIEQEAILNTLEEVCNRAVEVYNGNLIEQIKNSSGYEWFIKYVADEDKNVLTEAQKEKYKAVIKEQATAIGGSYNENELQAKIHESAGWFCYYLAVQTSGETFVNQFQNKAPQIRAKYLVEKRMYENWVFDLGQLGITNAELRNRVRTGFIQKYKSTPEEMILNSVEKATNGELPQIGEPLSIVSAIVAIIGAIIAIVQGIIAIVKSVVEIVRSDPKNAPSGAPSTYDFAGFGNNGLPTGDTENGNDNNGESSKTNPLLIGGIAIGALVITSFLFND
ncbi:MAG: transglutaminase-like domain-containing protein [Prevotellaceae bacterium]|jgi:hypothetical protein|nr:transglutaminase-like domain-containing protein [Prevotellaceae bacterium]